MSDEITSVDDLRGMLPTEVLAVVQAQQERIAALEGALLATMRRFDRNGKPCWCPHIFDDRVFHISDCERARLVLDARAGQPVEGVA